MQYNNFANSLKLSDHKFVLTSSSLNDMLAEKNRINI